MLTTFVPSCYRYSNVNNSNLLNTKVENSYTGVVNLSSRTLTEAELSLLSKGLNFVDTPPKPDMGCITEDLSKFHLSIKRHLAAEKFNLPTQQINQFAGAPYAHSKFKNPSRWNPPAPAIVEHMSLLTMEEAQTSQSTNPRKSNLSSAERTAKSTLANDPNIVIKKADKGSAVVIQNREDYIKEGLRQLSDRKFYRLQEDNLTEIHSKSISDAVNSMVASKEISLKTAEYLILENPRTAKFYLLPKIHKNTLPPPGRPIVSANECPSERISQFVDHFIQPLVTKIPSYLRDSSHLINILGNLKISNDAILCTLDVTSLYTNIPNDEGINAVGNTLFRNRDPSENPTNHSLCNLLRLVLTTNNFEFDNKHFLQVGGTAMGTKLAPSFANIFMGDFEDKFVYTYHLKPLIWKRFIDDIFFIWTYGDSKLMEFVNHLNNCHDTIKFTLEKSAESANFLDITISKDPSGNLQTTLYCKPTDSHNYLLYSSEHPRHVLIGIPYSQFSRLRRICSIESEFLENCFMLSSHFIRRGYPKNLILTALDRATTLNRDEILNKDLLKKSLEDNTLTTPTGNSDTSHKNKNTKTFYCITTHNPLNPPIRDIVSKNWQILGKSSGTRHLIDNSIIFGLRRNKNLSDHLVRASTRTKTEHIKHIEKLPCNDHRIADIVPN